MKNIKSALLLSGVLLSTLAVSPTVLAESHVKATTTTTNKASDTQKTSVKSKQDKANKKAIIKKAKSQNNLLKEVNKGVGEGFKKVFEATKLIKEDKPKEAIKKLQEATGLFDVALAANPKLALIPVASDIKITELLTTPELIKVQTDLAKEFLNDSKVQAARAVLAPMQDDIITRTVSLPMTTYPDAIKLATKMLVEKNKDAALSTLKTALSTMVEKVSVIPLSLLRVEATITTASNLDKEKDKDEVLILLNIAKQQLEVATALGYTTEQSELYEDISSQIKALKKEVTGGNVVEKLYSKLKTSMTNLIGKHDKQKETKKQK